jgi:hypothetical protein
VKISVALKLPPGLKRKAPVMPVEEAAEAAAVAKVDSAPTKDKSVEKSQAQTSESIQSSSEEEAQASPEVGAWEEVVEEKPTAPVELTRTAFGGSKLVQGSVRQVAVVEAPVSVSEPAIKEEESDDDLVVFKKKKRVF